MKKHYYITLNYTILLFIAVCSFGQPTLTIPYGSSVTVDGNLNQNEWADSDTLSIPVGGNGEVQVLYKHDSTNLMLAYFGPLESANANFPEVLIDVNNDKSTDWMSDDWWFHVSATDCESQGVPEDYSNCEEVRPNWTAEPNVMPGPPFTDTMEIEIPFTTIGVDLELNDTLGLSFELVNFVSGRSYWPVGAAINNPSTWGNGVFLPNIMTSTKKKLYSDLPFTIAPNPLKGKTLSINFEDVVSVENAYLHIYDCMGKIVTEKQLYKLKNQITLSLDPGVYYVHCATAQRRSVQRLVVPE